MHAHALPQQVPKTNGIQVTYGKQAPTHNWNRYVKRSFKRACHRAVVHGQAPYKGRILTVANSDESCSTPHVVSRRAPTHTPPHRLQVYCFNVGGLGSGMYEDLMGFLDQSHFDVALLQETKLRDDSEYTTRNWICIGSGTPAQKHAGVMILIRRTLTCLQDVKYEAILPGRLLRARFPFGATGRMLSIVCAYQHAWAPRLAHSR